jgi:integrase/recombinase XerD
MDNKILFHLRHKSADFIGIKTVYGDPRNDLIKKLAGIKWSKTHKCWYCPPDTENILKLEKIFGEKFQQLIIAEAYFSKCSKELQTFNQYMEVKRYSKETIKNYTGSIKIFLNYFGAGWHKLTQELMNNFQDEIIISKNFSSSYQNAMINAIKLFFLAVKNEKLAVEIALRPKRAKPLPVVLSQEDVKKLLLTIKNQKHLAMLSLLYSCGLRSGELTGLLPADIDSSRGFVCIKSGKGKKDRLVPLSLLILDMLRKYFTVYRPEKYLFEGARPGEPYAARSLQEVFKKAQKTAGIPGKLTLHTLRHSYATHLLEAGTHLRVIQEVLGHSSSKTTEIYTHVSSTLLQKVKSPFDDLNL